MKASNRLRLPRLNAFMRVCIAVMLALHYPLQLDPSRRCITSLVKVLKGQQSTIDAVSRATSNNVHVSKATSSNFGEIEMEQEESEAVKEKLDKDFMYYEIQDDEQKANENAWKKSGFSAFILN